MIEQGTLCVSSGKLEDGTRTLASPQRGEASDSEINPQGPGDRAELSVPGDEALGVGPLSEREDQKLEGVMAGVRNQPDQAQFSTILARIGNSLPKLAVTVACMMEERHEKATNEAGVVQGVQQLLYSSQSNLVVSSDEMLTDRNQHGSGSAPTYEESGTVAQTEHVRSPNPSFTEYDVYPTHIAYKIYQKGMQSTRCKRIGDGSFFIAKRSWDRLTRDFPTTKSGMKRLLPLAFDCDARFVYEEIAGVNPDANCEELWKLLGMRLCNEVHQSTLRDRFFAMTWNERRETFEKFAWRLRSASLLLPDMIDDGLLLNRLKNGLPNRLQDQPKLLSGTFDEVVSRVSSLSSAQGHRLEKICEVREDGVAKMSHVPSFSSDNRFAHVRCHYCQNLGHISRDCEKKMADRGASGKGRGDQPGPAGPDPKRN